MSGFVFRFRSSTLPVKFERFPVTSGLSSLITIRREEVLMCILLYLQLPFKENHTMVYNNFVGEVLVVLVVNFALDGKMCDIMYQLVSKFYKQFSLQKTSISEPEITGHQVSKIYLIFSVDHSHIPIDRFLSYKEFRLTDNVLASSIHILYHDLFIFPKTFAECFLFDDKPFA